MNELDCVKLIKPFKELKVGTKGCIVLKYTENDFEKTMVLKGAKKLHDLIQRVLKFYTITSRGAKLY